jgi:hypothetical protein
MLNQQCNAQHERSFSGNYLHCQGCRNGIELDLDAECTFDQTLNLDFARRHYLKGLPQ